MAVLAILILLAGGPAGAQTGQAILQRGPLPGRGVPFFPPNVLEVHWGEYLAGDSRVEVYFTREQLVLPAGWRRVVCGQEAVLRLDGEEKLTCCHVEPGAAGFALFLSFESESFPWCAWTQAFLRRLRYLLAFSQGPGEAPFPAVLDY